MNLQALNMNEKFSTTIYVNSTDGQCTDQQVDDLYENVKDEKCEITSNECNSSINSNSIPRIPPPIKPRLSLLSKKLIQNRNMHHWPENSNSCETLEQIDENLNLIMKRHNEKTDEQMKANVDQESSQTKDSSHDSEVIYLNNDLSQTSLKFDDEQFDDSSDDESNYESSYETSDQFDETNKLLSQISALNRNTYISDADVSEEMTRKFNLKDRLSDNYNEIEPIYSDIMPFDDNNTIYDVPTNSIKYLRPPPLPPRPPHHQSTDQLKNDQSDREQSPEKFENSEVRNEMKCVEDCSINKTDLRSELANELKKFHLKNAEFKSSQSSLNNVPGISTNPFVNQPLKNSDSKIKEFKECLNVMRKDHILSSTENECLKKHGLKSRLNRDELMMFERCLDDGFSSSPSTLSKSRSPKVIKGNNAEQGYGKINKVEINRCNQMSDDEEGSLKSSFSFMDSQMNSSSNETFSYKSTRSQNSNKQLKPNIGVITPFIRSSPSHTSSSNDLDNKHHFDSAQKNQLTVQLNDEFKSTLNSKASPVAEKESNENRSNFNLERERNQAKMGNKSDNFEKDQQVMQQHLINQQLINEQLSQQNKLNHEIENGVNQINQPTNQDHNNVRGYLYKTGSSRRPPFNKRWCALSESALFYYNEEKQNLSDLKSQAKGHIELNDILFINSLPGTIQHQTNNNFLMKAIKSKCNNIELCQFNVGIHSENGRIHLMASDHVNKRQFWVDILSVRIRPKLKPTQHIQWKNIDACGYLNIKIGLTGLWSKCFTVLQQRTLNVQLLDMAGSEEDGKKVDLISIDLRHVMSVGLNENAQIKQCDTVYESDYKSHSEQWLTAIQQNWKLPENGLFEDQLLAPNSIPIAIEKCLNFISTYNGIATKQIYQTPGDETCIKEILEHLKSETVFKYNILPEEGFTVQDVSRTLLIYLKSFPECLLTEILYQDFLKLNFCADYTERMTKLKLLLKRLPVVNYNTLKKLICHFMLLVENSDENEMDLDNLSQAVCPYLIFSKISKNPELSVSINLFKDLVDSYVWLFDLKQEELDKERKIENSLKELRRMRIKRDEDKLLVGIYLFNKTWGKIVNVSCDSAMTADDMLFYVTKIANLKESPDRLCVCEVVANDQLERVIHYSERIQQITLGWTVKWSQQDVKSNYLLIKPNTLYEELDEYFDKDVNSLPITLFNEVRFSEDGSKFRKVFLEFSSNSKDSKFNIYKDAKANKSLKSWPMDDVTWYLGSTVAKAPSRYCITFLDRYEPVQRQKEVIKSKIVSFNTGDELVKWLAAIICSEHPEGIYPLIHLNE